MFRRVHSRRLVTISLLFVTSTTILFFTVTLGAVAAHAQVPDQFTNLQYFPKTIPRQELIGIMRGFCFSLNVRCTHCHVAKAGGKPEELDFASDEKDTKKAARVMLRMAEAINQEYIVKLGRASPARVECVTCHHGLSIPKTMNGLLAETLEKKDIQAAIALYRDLRKQDFGDGQYNFGETPLNQFTESLLAQGKSKEAVAVMELNVEVNTPPSVWSYSLLAQAHAANKDIEKAKADFRKLLELNPQNQWAKKNLEELSSIKQ
jgi:tetratricopeptide (TPR) repeat protein